MAQPPSPIFVLRGKMDVVTCITFGPDETLFAGTIIGLIHVWCLKTNREKYSFQAGDSGCLSIHILDKTVIVQLKGGSIKVCTLRDSECKIDYELICSYMGFCKLVSNFDACKTVLYLPAENSKISAITLSSRTEDCSFKDASKTLGEVMAIKYFNLCNSSYLLAAYESGHLLIWDIANTHCISALKVDGTPMAIDFDPQMRRGVCGTESEKVSVFSVDESRSLFNSKSFTITNPGVSSVQIRPDKKVLTLGCWDGYIRLYSWKTLKLLAVLSEHEETIQDVCFGTPSKTAYCLAVASKDKRISLWDIYNS